MLRSLLLKSILFVSLAGAVACSKGFESANSNSSLDSQASPELLSAIKSGSIRLSIISAEQSVPAGTCSAQVQTRLLNSSGQAFTFVGSIGLSVTSSAVQIYSDSQCQTVTTAPLLQGSSGTATFYFKGNNAGTGTITASLLRILNASQAVTITPATNPPPPVPVAGQCGTANGVAVMSAPTANLCMVGTASAVVGTGPFTWTCAGTNGGATASCSAPRTQTPPPPPPPTPVAGQCGSANGVAVASAPTANLCLVGMASAVTGSGPFNWTCAGTNGGANASCSAPITQTPPPVPVPPSNPDIPAAMQIKTRHGRLCFQVNGSTMVLAQCNANSTAQIFEPRLLTNVVGVSGFAAYSIRSRSSGKCLEGSAALAALAPDSFNFGRSEPITLVDCNASEARQHFTINPIGTLIALSPKGMCVGARYSAYQDPSQSLGVTIVNGKCTHNGGENMRFEMLLDFVGVQ